MNPTGDVAVAYLEIALDAAKKGRYAEAQLNADEGASYAGIAARIAATEKAIAARS